MRVLQIFNQYLQRGGEEIWMEALPSLAGDEFEFGELRFRSADWVGEGAPSRLMQARWIGDNPESRLLLRESVERFDPGVLLFHNLIPVASHGLYDEARRLGLPVVQYIHNYRPFSASGNLWVNGGVNDAALRGNPWPEILAGAWNGSRTRTAVLAWHLGSLRRSGALDAVRVWIAISEFMRRKFVEAGIPDERVVTLRHCWETSPQVSGVQEGDYYLYLGALYASKGVNVLLDAWGILEQRLGDKCPRLLIAGKGPLENRVRAAAADSPRVGFSGFVSGDRKRELLATCRALLAPSVWWEPLGLVVYEAYECSRPVISSGSGGLAETIEDGRTGLLHRAGDPESLAGVVCRMEEAGSPGRDAMGRTGRSWLERAACPIAWKRRFKDIIENAARNRG